jgi:hypothetical protein
MSLPPRRRGETQEQYSRRIGRNPRTIGGRRRRRLVDPIVGTPNRRKDPRIRRPTRRVLSEEETRIRRNAARRRRMEREAEQRANLANQKKAMQALKDFRAKNPMPKQVKRRRMTIQEQAKKALKRMPKPVGSRQNPLTPEQRKKIRESMEGGRRRFREVLKRAGVLRRPKTTRSTVTAPVRKQRRPK